MVEQTLARGGSIDLLANIAGVVNSGPDNAVDQTDDGWDRVISINQTGVFYGMRAAGPPGRIAASTKPAASSAVTISG